MSKIKDIVIQTLEELKKQNQTTIPYNDFIKIITQHFAKNGEIIYPQSIYNVLKALEYAGKIKISTSMLGKKVIQII